MFKKALSILLAVMLIVSSVSITAISVAAADGDPVTYTVAGSDAAIFNGTSWDATNTANDMILDEATGNYYIVYNNVQPADAIQLKVVKDHGWDESYPADNYQFNVESVCDITVTFNPDTQEVVVTGDGVTQDEELVVESVIAVGNGEDTYLNGSNWDPCDPANAMIEDSENPGVWKMIMEDIYAFDNYQIKFAVNSVDEDGKPTSNPWAYNFGSEVEQIYPTGEEITAVYNGKNCIFEVEEDGSTVELTLDLRNFDFATKTGAMMRVDVTAPGEETTAPVEEETTAAPVVEPTDAPTTQSAPSGDGFTLNAISNFFTSDVQTYAEAPDEVVVNYYADVDTAKRLQAVQFEINYDPEVLTFDPAKNGEYDEDDEEWIIDRVPFPVADGQGDVNLVSPGRIRFAAGSEKGLRIARNGELIPIATLVFDVAEGAKGTTEVRNTIEVCCFQNGNGSDGIDYILYNTYGFHQDAYDEVTANGGKLFFTEITPEGTEPPTEAPTTEEPATEEPTTEQPATEEPTTEEPTTEPVPQDVYTVAGSSAAIFGTTWDSENTANDMTYNPGTGLFEITYADVEAEDAIQLKVLMNHSWDDAWGDPITGDNYTFNVTDTCDVTVTIDPVTKTVNVTGEYVTQDDSLDVETVIAVGNGEDNYLNGANWDPSDESNALVEVSDGIWEITYDDIYAFDNYQIKFTINAPGSTNPWAHNFGSEVEQLYPTGEEIDAVYNGKNCLFEVEEDGSSVTFQLDLREFDFKTR